MQDLCLTIAKTADELSSRWQPKAALISRSLLKSYVSGSDADGPNHTQQHTSIHSI